MAEERFVISDKTIPLVIPGVPAGYNIRTATRGREEQNQFIPRIVNYYYEISPTQYNELAKNPQYAKFLIDPGGGDPPLFLYGARLADSNEIRPLTLTADGTRITFANTSGSRELDSLIQETRAIAPQLYANEADSVRRQTGLTYINPTSAVASTDTPATPTDTDTGTGAPITNPVTSLEVVPPGGNQTSLTNQETDVSRSFTGVAPQSGGTTEPAAPGEAPGTGSGTGTGAGTGTPPGGATTGSTGSQPGQQATVNTQIVREKRETLIYPSDMKDDQDRIKFSLYKSKKQFNASPEGILNALVQGEAPGETSEEKLYTSAGGDIVYLPITKISDTNSVDWTDDRLDPLQAKIANLSLSLMDSGTQGQGIDRTRELLKEFGTNPAYGNMVRLRLAGEAASGANLLQRATGGIFNPNLQLLFNGPLLRSFQFNVGMISRNDQDAINIKKIIKFFKQNMATRVSTSGNLFLESPYVFKIEYQSGSALHQSLNRIKRCALQTCSVDYTPMGSYMTFSDESRTMFMYTMTLQFKELHPIYDIDYKDKHSIGL
jgi:hypothetical protein